MRTVTALALVALAWTAPAAAQVSIFRPEGPVAPEREAARQALYEVRDSVALVQAAIVHLRHDLRTTSASSMISRARSLARACAAGKDVVPRTLAALEGAPPATDLERKEHEALTATLNGLPPLLADCTQVFGAMADSGDGEHVRGYVNRRAEPFAAELRAVDRSIRGWFRAYRLRYQPRGAADNPLAG